MRNPRLTYIFWLLALSTCGLSLPGCSDLERVEFRNAEGIVVERYSRSKQDSLMEGLYELFDAAGTIMERANYTRGELDGTRTLYYPDGSVQYVEHHVGGVYEGPYKSYYPEGSVQLEGNYVGGEMSGIWIGYYPDGTKKEEVTFADNAENGPFREWYSNGVVKAEGDYLNGDNEQGELRLFDIEGKLVKRMHCESGACRTVWRPQTVSDDS